MIKWLFQFGSFIGIFIIIEVIFLLMAFFSGLAMEDKVKKKDGSSVDSFLIISNFFTGLNILGFFISLGLLIF